MLKKFHLSLSWKCLKRFLQASLILNTSFIVGAMAIEGNMFNGHTLAPQLEQVKDFTQGKIRKAIVDRGYRCIFRPY